MLKFWAIMLISLLPLTSFAQSEIIVLGDSISASYGFSAKLGWVNILQNRLSAQGSQYTFNNQSISGETSAGGLARLGEILLSHKPAWLLIELGVNDGLRGFPASGLKSNLLKMIEHARQSGSQVMLLGMKVPASYGKHYVEQFYQIYPQLSAELNVPYIPYILEGIADNPALMQADGLHPSAKAQSLIADTIEKALFPLLK